MASDLGGRLMRILSVLAEMTGTRVELAAIELAEERSRWAWTVGLAAASAVAGVFMLLLAVLALSFWLVPVLVPGSPAITAQAGAALAIHAPLAYAAGAMLLIFIACLVLLLRRLMRMGPALTQTRAVLSKDISSLRQLLSNQEPASSGDHDRGLS